LGNTILFASDDGVSGEELWATDGTPAGTWMVKDIDPAPNADSFPDFLTNMNGTVFFAAHDGSNGTSCGRPTQHRRYGHGQEHQSGQR